MVCLLTVARYFGLDHPSGAKRFIVERQGARHSRRNAKLRHDEGCDGGEGADGYGTAGAEDIGAVVYGSPPITPTTGTGSFSGFGSS